jgi:hypothetical protein
MTKQEFIDKKVAEFEKEFGERITERWEDNRGKDVEWRFKQDDHYHEVEAFLRASLSEAMGEVEKVAVEAVHVCDEDCSQQLYEAFSVFNEAPAKIGPKQESV